METPASPGRPRDAGNDFRAWTLTRMRGDWFHRS